MPNKLIEKFKVPIVIFLVGIILLSVGILFIRSGNLLGLTKVEVLDSKTSESLITVEIAGEIINPGVYKLINSSRVDDLIVSSGGFSASADREWVNKYLNRAAKLTDGQKVFIPKVGNQNVDSSAKTSGVDQSVSLDILGQNTNLININTASTQELDKLSGIGPTYAQKITEHRPYSNTEELVSKKVISKSLYEKIKNEISVY